MENRPDESLEVPPLDPLSQPLGRAIDWAGLIGGLALLGWALLVAMR